MKILEVKKWDKYGVEIKLKNSIGDITKKKWCHNLKTQNVIQQPKKIVGKKNSGFRL